jgi:hypothetical protein
VLSRLSPPPNSVSNTSTWAAADFRVWTSDAYIPLKTSGSISTLKLMNVKQAVELAKARIRELFADEEISNLGLEEVDFDERDDHWVITVGFSRPWDTPRSALAGLSSQKRTYKTIRIDNKGNDNYRVKNREIAS